MAESNVRKSSWGESTKEHLLNSFTQSQPKKDGSGGTERIVTDTLRDRLLCHIAIVSLFVARFQIPNETVKYLQLHLKMLESKYAPHHIASPHHISHGITVMLTRPLSFVLDRCWLVVCVVQSAGVHARGGL